MSDYTGVFKRSEAFLRAVRLQPNGLFLPFLRKSHGLDINRRKKRQQIHQVLLHVILRRHPVDKPFDDTNFIESSQGRDSVG